MAHKKGPWMVLGSKIVYKSPWMEVREDKVLTPAGKKGSYGTVRIKPGATVVALDENLNVYLIQDYQYGIGKTILQAVGGGIEKGQSPLQAAKRELLEETGLKSRKLTLLGKSQMFTSFLEGPVYLYLAENLSQGKATPEETEVIQIVKMPLRRALQLVKEGKIIHAATALALMKIAALKKIN